MPNTIALPLFEIAFVLVRLDYFVRVIVNANDGIMRVLKLIVLKEETLTRQTN